MLKELDPLLHSQIRLAIVSILMGVDEAQFNYLKEKTETTAGNLSFQLSKLKEANYIKVSKGFKDNYPLTTVRMTAKGKKAFEEYVITMKQYLQL
ncbi:MAG: transcriptional regulator [Chitinophagaceae bacterium]|jgi:DNA-binding MarR family transcriptional regulator|nr:MAG: transcriptional regulator [Chitinophagaceae bacterium]